MFLYYFNVIERGVGPQNYTFGSGCPAKPMTSRSAAQQDPITLGSAASST